MAATLNSTLSTKQAQILHDSFILGLKDVPQEMVSEVAAGCTQKTMNGRYEFEDKLGVYKSVEITSSGEQTGETPADKTRRALYLRQFKLAERWSTVDSLQTALEPQSDFLRGMMYEMERRSTQVCLEAMGGNSLGGVDGQTKIALPVKQKIASVTTANALDKLNLQAILRARKVLLENKVPMMDWYLALDSEQEENLLKDTKIQSIDYLDTKTIVSGRLPNLYGFNIVSTEELKNNAAAFRFGSNAIGVSSGGTNVAADGAKVVYAWWKPAVQCGRQADFSRVSEMYSHDYEIQTYFRRTVGATRFHDEGVIAIHCKKD